MMDFKRLLHKPNLFTRVFGIKLDKFLGIVERIQNIWGESEIKRLCKKKRKRAIGGGRKYNLETIEEKTLLVLLFYRYNMTHELLGVLFGLDQSNATRLINKMLPIFEQAVDPNLKTYFKEAKQYSEKVSTPVEFLKKYPELKTVIVDATEQRRLRPQSNNKRKKVFSGKKKAFTNKTQILINSDKRIIDVSKNYDGSVHDKKIFDLDNTAKKIPAQSTGMADLGYVGVPKEHPYLNMILAYKKPKGKELSQEQKDFNKQHAQKRVVVEHVIGRCKKFRILADTYRGKEGKYNLIFRNVAALVNLNYCST